MVGNANGRSMTALTIALPRKSSRTSTQAVTVPSTALTNATMAAAPRVSSRAATASGLVAASQNVPTPCRLDSQTTAAIGSVTISERNAVTKPNEMAVWALSFEIRAPGGAAAAGVALASRSSDRLLDPDHQAGGRVEPALLGGTPAAEDRTADPDQATGGVLGAVLLRGGRIDRPESVLREQLLGRLGLHKADE